MREQFSYYKLGKTKTLRFYVTETFLTFDDFVYLLCDSSTDFILIYLGL